MVTDQNDITGLEEILEFIDSLDWGGNNTDTSTKSSSTSSLSSFSSGNNDVPELSLGDAITTKQCKRGKKTKRKRRTLSSSTRLQQSKRAELLFLRRRVQELEECIKHLQSQTQRPDNRLSNAGACTSIRKVEPMWMRQTETQYQARLLSEETNRKLKTILAIQVQVNDSLCAFLKQHTAFQEMNSVYPKPMVPRLEYIAVRTEVVNRR